MFDVNLFFEMPAKTVIKQDIAVAYVMQLIKGKNNQHTECDPSQLINSPKAQSTKHDLSQLKHKKLLSVEEASDLFGIGRGRIRALSNSADCPFVLWVGDHRRIKNEAFEQYLMEIQALL